MTLAICDECIRAVDRSEMVECPSKGKEEPNNVLFKEGGLGVIHSVIHINGWYCDTEEMLIPICIGNVHSGYGSRQRINRLLPIGHRWRGDI